MFGLYYRALMASELPEQIECRQLAAGTGVLNGVLAASRLTRIEETYRVVGAVTVDDVLDVVTWPIAVKGAPIVGLVGQYKPTMDDSVV